MSTVNPKARLDGWLALDGGIDSGRAPNLLAQNQNAFSVNTTYRGAWPTCRPGLRKINLSWEGEVDAQLAFMSGLFQEASPYQKDDGSGSIIASIGGRQFRAFIGNTNTFSIQEITIPGDLNPSNRDQAWSVQGENYWILQDGQSKPFIYNGSVARRALQDEVPTANQITYHMGRLWIARGREYLGGDIVFGPSGTGSLGFRDSMLKFTESQYLLEGGSFGVPVQSGDIVGLKPIANINTALGQGELIVYTRNAAFATAIPQDRATWKLTTQLLQRIVQLSDGAYAQASIVNVNEDLYSRSKAGIRSLAFSVRNAGQPGNNSVSNEMSRILDVDPEPFLRFSSGAYFDNRLLMTASPGISQGHGVYHRCLAVLDCNLLTSMRQKLPPAWEGIWTGLRILRILTASHAGVERCFIFALNNANEIELWELSRDLDFDQVDGQDVRITWSMESRALDFGSKFDQKQLFAGDLFHDNIVGTVDFDIKFRPDSYPCWIDWDSWQECAKYKICTDEFGTCPTLPNYQAQYRPKRQLKQPPDSFDPILKTLYRNGYEFQSLLTVIGKARVKQCRLVSYDRQEPPFGRQL